MNILSLNVNSLAHVLANSLPIKITMWQSQWVNNSVLPKCKNSLQGAK